MFTSSTAKAKIAKLSTLGLFPFKCYEANAEAPQAADPEGIEGCIDDWFGLRDMLARQVGSLKLKVQRS